MKSALMVHYGGMVSTTTDHGERHGSARVVVAQPLRPRMLLETGLCGALLLVYSAIRTFTARTTCAAFDNSGT